MQITVIKKQSGIGLLTLATLVAAVSAAIGIYGTLQVIDKSAGCSDIAEREDATNEEFQRCLNATLETLQAATDTGELITNIPTGFDDIAAAIILKSLDKAVLTASSPAATRDNALPSDLSGKYLGVWRSDAVCSSSDAPNRWTVALTQSGTSVQGGIAFHNCPDGGRVGYEVQGTDGGFDPITLYGTKIEGQGALDNTTPDFQTFTFSIGSAPSPNFAEQSNGSNDPSGVSNWLPGEKGGDWYALKDWCVNSGGTLPTIAQLKAAYDECLSQNNLTQGQGCLPEGFHVTGHYWSIEDSDNVEFPTQYALTFVFSNMNTVNPSGGTVGEVWKTREIDGAVARCIKQ